MYKRSVLPLEIASLYNSIRSRECVVPPLYKTNTQVLLWTLHTQVSMLYASEHWPLDLVNNKSWPLDILNNTSWPLDIVNNTSGPLDIVNNTSWPLDIVNNTSWPLDILNNTSWPLDIVNKTSWPIDIVYVHLPLKPCLLWATYHY